MQIKFAQRHNRKHDPKPGLTATGRVVFNLHLASGSVTDLTDTAILAALHYSAGIVGLPNGGLRLKKALKLEAKKRGLM